MLSSVALGLESGHPRILKYLKGDSVSIEDNTRAAKILHQNGITPNAAFFIGSPTETEEEIMTTYNFIRSMPVQNFNVYVMTPLPGTPIWSEALERGLISEKFDDWTVLDSVHFAKYYKKAVILSQTLSREELYKIYKKFQVLRYWTFSKNAYRHPFTKDVPKMLCALIKEKVTELVRT